MSERETGQVTRDAVGRNQFFSEIFSRELSIKATCTNRIIELVRADRKGFGLNQHCYANVKRKAANEQRSDQARVLRAIVTLKSHMAS